MDREKIKKIGPCTCMNNLMTLPNAVLREGLVTDFTHIRSFSRMNSFVWLHRLLLSKAFIADITKVTLFLSQQHFIGVVNFLMKSQLSTGAKCFLTCIAFEWLFTSVTPCVFNKFRFCQKSFVTQFALMEFCTRVMTWFMSLQYRVHIKDPFL